jgi:hypothetical protein
MTPADRERLSEVLRDLDASIAEALDDCYDRVPGWTPVIRTELLAEARAIVDKPAEPIPVRTHTEIQQAMIDAFDRMPTGNLMALGPPRPLYVAPPNWRTRLRARAKHAWATMQGATSANTHPKGKNDG